MSESIRITDPCQCIKVINPLFEPSKDLEFPAIIFRATSDRIVNDNGWLMQESGQNPTQNKLDLKLSK
jgi:hypothetical protein